MVLSSSGVTSVIAPPSYGSTSLQFYGAYSSGVPSWDMGEVGLPCGYLPFSLPEPLGRNFLGLLIFSALSPSLNGPHWFGPLWFGPNFPCLRVPLLHLWECAYISGGLFPPPPVILGNFFTVLGLLGRGLWGGHAPLKTREHGGTLGGPPFGG